MVAGLLSPVIKDSSKCVFPSIISPSTAILSPAFEIKTSPFFISSRVTSFWIPFTSIIALFGASSSVLKFEDIRVQKEMNGKVNRIVNCQSANLNKTLNASVEQIDAIRRLQQSNKFNNLDDNLKEIALLRLEYPDMSLVELGKKLKEPLGKSGVNYRLKRIIKIAEDL